MLRDVTMATQQCYVSSPNPLLNKARLTTLNLNHFKFLKLFHQGPLEFYHLPTKFYENLSIDSEAISEGHTDRQTDW
jgi:hypothetical protein